MKKYSFLFLLLAPVLLGAQVIGTVYQASTIRKLIDGDCRTKRVIDSTELVIHSQFKTVQFTSLRDLYPTQERTTPFLFPYYVFREVGEGLVLEDTGTTDGVLAVRITKEGVYYGLLNGPDCVVLVRLEASLNPLVGEAVLYDCCVWMGDLN